MVPTANMSDARRKYSEWGKCLDLKQAQLVTMHSWYFSDKGRASQRVGCLMGEWTLYTAIKSMFKVREERSPRVLTLHIKKYYVLKQI